MNILHPIITDDGSISLYSETDNDIYHSQIGAYTESFEKFIKPSGIINHVKEKNDVKILDICFGLGYNSKAALNKIYSENPGCHVKIDCLDIDISTFLLAGIIDYEQLKEHAMTPFRLLTQYMSERPEFYKAYKDLTEEIKKHTILEPQFEEFKKYAEQSLSEPQNRAFLHNIYYRTNSTRNKTVQNIQYEGDNAKICYYIGDARVVISGLNEQYDCIFLDGFTPHKAPALWTVEFIKELYRLTSNHGCVITYTSSAAVRSAFIEAEFFIYRSEPVGRKSSGTIAFKHVNEHYAELSDIEKGLLFTKASTPYRDDEPSLTNFEILNNRVYEQHNSSKPSASQFLKKIHIRKD